MKTKEEIIKQCKEILRYKKDEALYIDVNDYRLKFERIIELQLLIIEMLLDLNYEDSRLLS